MSAPLYVWKFKAQAWPRDRYYVNSGQPVKRISVVASTEEEARDEARRALGELNRDYYWRFWLIKAKDQRIVREGGEEKE